MSTFNVLAQQGVEQFVRRFQRTGGVWVFHHIPKTAGTSLTRELSLCLGPYRNIAAGYSAEQPNRQNALMEATEAFIAEYPEYQYRSASGHLRLLHLRRIRDALPHARFFTFLRDPIDRLVSEFRYTRTPKQPNYQEYQRKYPTIEAYVEDETTQNKMWNFVAPRDLAADEDGLRKVFNRYFFIGTLTDLQEDFAFLTGLVGCPKQAVERQNITKRQDDNTVELTPELRRRILERNAADAAFYEGVRTVLDARRGEMRDFVAERRALFQAAVA